MRTMNLLVMALALGICASPALAQGKGKHKDDRDRREYAERYDRRYDRYQDRRGGGPPFCRNGNGHPVHGRRWCIEKGFGLGSNRGRYDDRRYEDRRRDDRRYDDYRRDRDYDRDRDYRRSGAYEQDHAEFHRWHDRECRERASRRPLDVRWQLEVRAECKRRHDDWHHRAGRRH